MASVVVVVVVVVVGGGGGGRGSHALHIAALCGHHEIVKFIVDFCEMNKSIIDDDYRKEFLNTRNSSGQTPYWIAARGKGYPDREKCKDILKEVDQVDVHICDDSNVTPNVAGEESVRKRAVNEEKRKQEMISKEVELLE